MKPSEHIEKLLKECHDIQEHGHCENNPPAWVAVSDIEIAVNDLKEVFEDKEKQNG